MKSFFLINIVAMGMCGWSRSAEPLSGWLLEQVQKDEQLLKLLKDSRIYMPFFLEAPRGHASALARYNLLFDAWRSDKDQTFCLEATSIDSDLPMLHRCMQLPRGLGWNHLAQSKPWQGLRR